MADAAGRVEPPALAAPEVTVVPVATTQAMAEGVAAVLNLHPAAGGGGPSMGIIADGTSEVSMSGNTFDLGQPGLGGFAGTYANPLIRPPTALPGLRQEFYQDVPIGLPQSPQPTN